MNTSTNYILITAAYNEAEHIEKTLQSVVNQTVRPMQWVIVSDGSTDDTDTIVRRYEDQYPFIKYVRRDSDDTGFASQSRALMTGYRQVRHLDHGFIGTLDADITFEPDYYERLLARFEESKKLGLAGGMIQEIHEGKHIPLSCNPQSVPGAIQLYRKEAFDKAGGLLPLRRGGHDAVAETAVRMHGWQVRTFTDVKVLHLRPCGASYGNSMRIRFNLGIREYAYGNHPLFELVKCLHRLRQKPFLLGSLSRWFGYCWAFLRREPRETPADVIRYLRREQLCRLHPALALRRRHE